MQGREAPCQDNVSEEQIFSATQKELSGLVEEIDAPDHDINQLSDKRVSLEEAIQKCDLAWSTFMQQSNTYPKGKYLREERLLREALALQQTRAVELSQLYRSLITHKISALDTQYWEYKNDLLPTKKDKSEQQQINMFLSKILHLKQTYEHLLNESDELHDFMKLMENKKYTGYRELVKSDPWDRYDKEAKAKAKRYATEGPEKDPKYALQYLSGNPITQADKGKCAITDEHIERDTETMKKIVDTATEKSKNKKQKEFIRRTPQSAQYIPGSLESVKEAYKTYDQLCQELREKGFMTTYLVASVK